MLKKLRLTGVGDMPEFTFEFGSRFNVLTGDNGLGKTFLLDLVWYALTRRWLYDVNPQLMYGYMAQPSKKGSVHEISFDLNTAARRNLVDYKVSFNFDQQAWIGKPGRPYSSGLVIYAHVDGGFSVWDPSRNYWVKRGNIDSQEREPAFVFTNYEVWNGQYKYGDGASGKKQMCTMQGLLSDVALWQSNSTSREYRVLKSLLEKISPPEFSLRLGNLVRYSLDDVREIPSVDIGYGEIPVLWASSAIKRIMSMAYVLVWAFSEHIRASEFLRTTPTSQVTLLFDELDAHLHPKWQRTIMTALMDTVKEMMRAFAQDDVPCDIQIVASTHSPLVMSSLEDRFDPKSDSWFDFDYGDNGAICIEKRVFSPKGSAENWLTSQAFDLTSTYSPDVERLVKDAEREIESPNGERLRRIRSELATKLPPGNDLVYRLDQLIKDLANAES